MSRFEYLEDKKEAKASKSKKKTPAPDGRRKGESGERVEAVYLRTETIRAAWREYRKDGGESLSELVEDLLLQWLRERA